MSWDLWLLRFSGKGDVPRPEIQFQKREHQRPRLQKVISGEPGTHADGNSQPCQHLFDCSGSAMEGIGYAKQDTRLNQDRVIHLAAICTCIIGAQGFCHINLRICVFQI